ncbi:hypothetical protein, partial [Mucilaginibacter antarcticus]
LVSLPRNGVVNLTRNHWSHSAGIGWSISAVYPTYDTELGLIVPKAKSLPEKVKGNIKNEEYLNIINTSRRIGAWFGQFNQSEILLYFNLQF